MSEENSFIAAARAAERGSLCSTLSAAEEYS